MKKEEQLKINEMCDEVFHWAMYEMNNEGIGWHDYKRLRSCTACVYETSSYYILRSYSTCIAVIEKSTDTLYDCLRSVYGYTATSAQHISKFDKDYGRGKWGCEKRYTYREA